MQQGSAPDVAVQQGHRRAQLGQSQPSEEEGGFVPHEQSHGVPGSEPGLALQGPGHFVAPPVGVGEGEPFVSKHDEGFLGKRRALLQEPVQDGEEGSPPPPAHNRDQNPQKVPRMDQVHPQQGAQGPDEQREDEDAARKHRNPK